MNKTLKYALLATLALGLVALAACGDDDNNDGGGTTPPTPEIWEGTWLSTGADVAPVLVTAYDYDSVYVSFAADQTVTLRTHPVGGPWTTQNGTYGITESDNSDIDVIQVAYPGLQQEGIVEFWTDTPDSMWLEVVPVGAGVPIPSVEGGFSVDDHTAYRNIQVYRRVSY